MRSAARFVVLASLIACHGAPVAMGGSKDLSVGSVMSADLSLPDAARPSDLARAGDLRLADLALSGDLACNVNAVCAGACCGGRVCTSTQACQVSCGAAQAVCVSSAACCYGLRCDTSIDRCVACVGAGRVGNGYACPNGDGDCCNGACIGGFCSY